MFEDNGHNRQTLAEVVKSYTPPTLNGQKQKEKKKQSNIRPNSMNTHLHSYAIPDNLFDVLPFKNTKLGEDEETKPYVVMQYLPGGIYYKIKKACAKAGVTLVTRPGNKLQSILCRNNKTRHDRKNMPGVYKLIYPCSPHAKYHPSQPNSWQRA